MCHSRTCAARVSRGETPGHGDSAVRTTGNRKSLRYTVNKELMTVWSGLGRLVGVRAGAVRVAV